MNVLVLSAQFPFPPRSGFETRVYQLTRQLATRHNVTLLSYAEAHKQADADLLAETIPVRIVEWRRPTVIARRLGQLASIASSRPFACHSVYSTEMQQAIDEMCADGNFDVVQLESTLFCQFHFPPHVKVVLDEHNIEYEVFWRMCQSERSMLRRLFNRVEHRRFRRFEQRSWTQIDGCLVTSEREVEVLADVAPTLPIAVVPNGVDLDYFRPLGEPEPYTVVFNGVLDYRPNLDAALHLVEDIWPLVRQRCPQARLQIVGRAGSTDTSVLAGPGVEVTGEVPDVRPYLQHAAVVTVPIRMGGGTRLKVVEGLSMGKAMVSTSLGCEGIDVRDGEHLLIADDAASFAQRILQVFEQPALGAELGARGRTLVERDYSWDLAGDRVEDLYETVLGSDSPQLATITRSVG